MNPRNRYGMLLALTACAFGWPDLPYGWDHPTPHRHRRRGANVKIQGVPGKFKRRKRG